MMTTHFGGIESLFLGTVHYVKCVNDKSCVLVKISLQDKKMRKNAVYIVADEALSQYLFLILEED